MGAEFDYRCLCESNRFRPLQSHHHNNHNNHNHRSSKVGAKRLRMAKILIG